MRKKSNKPESNEIRKLVSCYLKFSYQNSMSLDVQALLACWVMILHFKPLNSNLSALCLIMTKQRLIFELKSYWRKWRQFRDVWMEWGGLVWQRGDSHKIYALLKQRNSWALESTSPWHPSSHSHLHCQIKYVEILAFLKQKQER